MKCSWNSEILHGSVHDTTRISSCFSDFVYHELMSVVSRNSLYTSCLSNSACTIRTKNGHTEYLVFISNIFYVAGWTRTVCCSGTNSGMEFSVIEKFHIFQFLVWKPLHRKSILLFLPFGTSNKKEFLKKKPTNSMIRFIPKPLKLIRK